MLNVQTFDIIDSTNTEASRQLDSTIVDGINLDEKKICALHKKIIFAREQTAGRGRVNRSFFSPKNSGIYFSIIYIPKPTHKFMPAIFTATAAVGVSRAIKKVFKIEPKIKWVNDVYINEKKICGILTEAKINPATGQIYALIIGIGINLYTPQGGFPDDIKNRVAAILECEYKTENSNNKFMEIVAAEVLKIFDDEKLLPAVMEEYRSLSNLIGKKIQVYPVINDSKNFSATVLDITEDAKLKVQNETGEIIFLDSGEVSVR